MDRGRMVIALLLAGVAGACGSFEGMRGPVHFGPAGTSIAVSRDRIVQSASGRTTIWARDAARTRIASFATVDLFGPLLCRSAADRVPPCDATALGNARVRFDAGTGRWFLLTSVPTGPGRWLLAVSATVWPEWGWRLYEFAPWPAWFGGAGYRTQETYPDQPGLGIARDTVLLTGNLADAGAGLAYAEQSAVLLLNKAHLIAGLPVATAYFHPSPSSSALWLLQPSQHDDGSSGQVAVGVNVMTTQGTALRVQVLRGVPGTVDPPTMTRHDVYPDVSAPFRNPPDARQPGPLRVPLVDQRVRDVAVRGGQIWAALHQGCYPPDDVDGAGQPAKRACARYLSVLPGVLTPLRDIRLRLRRQYYYLPAIAFDAQGNLLSTVLRSSEDEFPSVYLTGRRAADAPEAFRAPVRVRAAAWAWDWPPPLGDIEFNGAAGDPAGVGAWFSTVYPAALDAWGTWNGAVHEQEY